MSYRELRDIAEILRSLGFPRLISIENFRLPNFELISEILEWTVAKFDPNIRIPRNIDNETDRIIFIKTCVLTLIQKAKVRLNPKCLYQSDGHAVRELLLVLRLLYAAKKGKVTNSKDANEMVSQILDLRSKIGHIHQEIRRSTNLVFQIPQTAANIHDFLSKEIYARDSRNKTLSQLLNANEVEHEVSELIERIEKQTADVQFKLSNISTDEQDLEQKVEKRRREYDQLQKRLAKLQSFRPPYMDEYERYETQLKEYYNIYIVLFRNLSHLQQSLWEVERTERERLTSAEQNMRLAVDKMRLENDISVPPMFVYLQIFDKAKQNPLFRMMELNGENTDSIPQIREVKVFGNMIGAGLSDDDDDDDDDDDEDEDVDENNGDNDDEIDLNNSYNIEEQRRREAISNLGKDKDDIDENLDDDKIASENIDTKNLEAIMEHEEEENSDDDF